MNLIFLRDSRAKEMFKSVKIPTLELTNKHYKPTLDCQAGGVLGCQLCCTGHGSWAVISLLAKPLFLDINLSHVYI